MLRRFALLMLAANLAFFAWTQGWLDDIVGLRAIGDREPQRLAKQVKPETVTVLSPAAAASAVAPTATSRAAAPTTATAPPEAPTSCLEAGPFASAEVAAAMAAAQSVVGADRITEQRSEKPGRWIVYLGQYLTRDDLTKKADELKKLGVEYLEVRGAPELEPGLQLGYYSERANAERALEQFGKQGVRGARIVQTVPPGSSTVLRIERTPQNLVAPLTALKDDALRGGFKPCAKPAG
jgi:hypothetical protein